MRYDEILGMKIDPVGQDLGCFQGCWGVFFEAHLGRGLKSSRRTGKLFEVLKKKTQTSKSRCSPRTLTLFKYRVQKKKTTT